MELKDYTDEELRGELKRRSIERRKAAKAEIKKETYVYTEAVVNQYTRVYHEKIFDISFYFENGALDVKRPYDNSAHLARNCGFNLSTMPQVGDLVRLRKRNHVNQKLNVFSPWQICEVIKRNGNED